MATCCRHVMASLPGPSARSPYSLPGVSQVPVAPVIERTFAERWREPAPRDGWDTTFLQVGGRWRDDAQDPALRRRLGTTMLATAGIPATTDDKDVRYLATVVAKLLQRGVAPPVPGSRKIDQAVTTAEILTALAGPPSEPKGSREVDAVYALPGRHPRGHALRRGRRGLLRPAPPCPVRRTRVGRPRPGAARTAAVRDRAGLGVALARGAS